MKRTVSYALLLVLMVFSAFDGVAAKKKRSPRQVKPTAVVEQTLAAKEAEQADKAVRGPFLQTDRKQVNGESSASPASEKKDKIGPPVERKLKKAKGRKPFDLRSLPQTRPRQKEKPEREGPEPNPVMLEEGDTPRSVMTDALRMKPVAEAAAPAPLITFEGLDRFNWGAGSPPDTTGDVGPDYYIQAVNTSVGIYRKSDGFQEAAFTFDTLMSQGNFGNLCDTDNFGDPVVLYDTFEDRWVVTDFAFILDGGGNVNPPIAFQCFAVSMNGDPLTGGWNFYSIQVDDGLHDYEKLAVWTDGIYMSANMFGFPAGSSFFTARAWAINKAQMYAGESEVDIVTFDIGGGDFTVIPSNARLQTGTPPPNTPAYFVSTWQFLNALTVYKFDVDWDNLALSTLTGPDTPLAATSWPNAAVANVPQSGTAQLLDALQIRAMVQLQYTNFGGTESLWLPHTVRRGNTTGFAAPRWYQADVTGGTVAANLLQAATWDPDAANVMHRWMPSLALDRAGNMALAYSTSSSTTFPSIKYAGRLSTDPINTFSQTEQIMLTGTASQTSSARWGDYSSVMLDPDGCTFWITNEYANPASQASNMRWLTRIGAFKYAECTPVGDGGTLSGTVTATVGGAPIVGATINFGARTDITDGSGFYEFTDIPAGTYPSISASQPGYLTSTATSIVVVDSATTTQNFTLDLAPTSACLTDTTQADFQMGVGTDVDVDTTPGDVILAKPSEDQSNGTIGTSGVGITVTTWGGQTFTPSVTGTLTQVDVNLFCAGCTGTTPNLTLSIRATAGGVPTGGDLASGTIPGFSNGGVASYFSVVFGAPASLTAGTMYAFVVRPTANPSPGTYALTRSGTSTVGANVYAGGTRVSGATSGTVWSIPTTGGVTTDAGFVTYMDSGYLTSGTFISSLKDSNPLAGLTPTWSTITWNGTTPTDTTITLQVAGSNSQFGPWNYVGPDGTGATFFASGSSLSQFYNLRYLKYKAALATTNTAVTPSLHDVQVCYQNSDCSTTVATITPTPPQVCAGSSGNTATGPAGATTYAWSIANGSIQGSTSSQAISYTAGATGTVDLTLMILMPDGCQDEETINVPINPIPSTPTITPDGPTTFCDGGSVTLTSSSATGNQWYDGVTLLVGETNATYVATTSGSYNVVVTLSGCSSAPSTSTVVTVNPIPPTPTISGLTSFCTGGSVTLTSSSATGNQWYRNNVLLVGETAQTHIATLAGAYSVTVTIDGCSTGSHSEAKHVTVNPNPDATITVASPMFAGASSSASVPVASVGSTYAWSITGGTINSGAGTPNITFTAGAAGTLNLQITVTTAAGCFDTDSVNVTVQDAPFGAPPNLQATASGTTSANLTWAPVLLADHYEIYRSTDNVTYTLRGTSPTPAFSEGSLTASTTYFYKVRAIKADLTPSAYSAIDPATTVVFTDNPLVFHTTKIKTVHISQLRTAVNLARAAIGLAAATFTDPTLLTTTKVKAVHINELRTALAPVLSAISVTPSYTDPTITGGTTKIKTAHVSDLRNLIQ
ncbi:MAG TPA: carboxypeptidase regulatory-like domain-containing protein [Thermoanaerobaculia bacterium]|nr:carboxypeptidase regulatory-like domain-containing protein [Thermoanaerobaculia bacterium]